MNDYSLTYLQSLTSNALQKRIVELISQSITEEEMLKILIKEVEAGLYD